MVDQQPIDESGALNPDIMLALAQFAAGVAHDLNNHLTGVVGFASVLSRSVESPTGKEHLSELQAAAERAGSLARAMQAFGRRPTTRLRELDLGSELSGVLAGARHHLPTGLTLVMPEAMSSALAIADASLLTGGLFELLAQLALITSSGGSLSVSVTYPLPTIHIVVHPATINAAVLLRRCRPYGEPKTIHGNGLALASAWAAMHYAGGNMTIRDVDDGIMVDIVFASPASVDHRAP